MPLMEGASNSGNRGNDDDMNGNEKKATSKINASSVVGNAIAQKKMTTQKKKQSGKNSDDDDGCDNNQDKGQDYEKEKRRNSLTDSPLTELSPSSAASNGDSADDNGSEGLDTFKPGSSDGVVSTNTSVTGMYAVNSSSYGTAEGTAKESVASGGLESTYCYAFNESDNIDAMELETVHDISANIKKQLIKQLKYNKWTDALCRTILTGDFYGFNRRFKLVMLCLRKRQPQIYAGMSNPELAAFVAQGIVERFSDCNENTSILMLLLANHDVDTGCKHRTHGPCRIAHMLMKLLKRESLTKLCEMVATRTGKTALHLAVATGNECQLRVLLALAEMNPNVLDMSGRAPIHYAVERNNLNMVRMLMWYGADMSQVQSGNFKYDPLYISLRANPSGTVNHWLQARVKALSHKMLEFATRLVRKKVHVAREMSTIHFIRLPKDNWPSKIECQLNLYQKNANNSSHNSSSSPHKLPWSREHLILFMIPIAFQAMDEKSAASNPQVVRLLLPNEFFISGQPILDRPNDVARILKNAFTPHHNGEFYAFELPHTNEALHCLSFRVGPGAWKVGLPEEHAAQQQQPHHHHQEEHSTIIAMQAFQCFEVDRVKPKTD